MQKIPTWSSKSFSALRHRNGGGSIISFLKDTIAFIWCPQKGHTYLNKPGAESCRMSKHV